jgi:molybdopterin converting factor small subunit
MRVNVSFCAVLRTCAGSAEHDLEIAEGASLADAIGRLDLPAGLEWIACVNGRPAPGETTLAEGDSLYVFLPVSGG